MRGLVLRSVVVTIVGLIALAGPAAAKRGAEYAGSIAPAPVNQVDCNGWSPKYEPARPAMRALCTDPIHVDKNGNASRLIDNGWYVGHDEPSVKFVSGAAGSGNAMTYYMQLPVDPSASPTASGSVTDYAELSVAPWFGLPICDSNSYPQNSCTPDSDSNSGSISDPSAAGSAFMELQFYPPGFTPFLDAESCSPTQWCSALNIDSLECTFGFASCNNNCVEPVNFAYLQTNGVPAGSPAPQTPDIGTFFGNTNTLKMNPGDVLKVSITDPASGLTVRVDDLTTGQSGFIQASAANGFANTNMSDCSGNPHTFHAEYSTASQPNQVPWAALEGGVLMQQEVGHFESCDSVANRDPFSADFGAGGTYNDPGTYQNCGGGLEGPGATGEGPCTDTGGCTGATTQGMGGPTACSTNDPSTGALCEFSDGPCHVAGSRAATINGQPTTETQLVAGCNQTDEENGDLDFDGNTYQPDWPNGSANYPTSFRYIGPFMQNGQSYPQIQFETDAPGSENLCDPSTGTNCTVPPISASFYPFWTLNYSQTIAGSGSSAGACVWNFGNDIALLTNNDFGRTGQYGSPDLARYGGTNTSALLTNPTTISGCGAPTASSPPTISGELQQGQTLTESHATWSNGSTDYSYQWEDCGPGHAQNECTPISGATGQTYTLTAADIGHTIRVQETVPGASGTIGRSTSFATGGIVVEAPPSNISPPTISGITTPGQLLTESHGVWGNNPTSFTYQWEDCDSGTGGSCTPIAGATGQTYTLAASDLGHRIVVLETATNSTGSTAASSAPTAVVVVSVPVNTARPTISGNLLQGQTVTESHGTWTNGPIAFAYQWEDCNSAGTACTPIAGATGQFYTLTGSDVGHTVVVLETASNSLGAGAPASSSPTGVVRPFALAPTIPTAFPAPVVSGTQRVGSTLRSTTGLWWATPPLRYAYQWQRCKPGCTNIRGATGSSYKLVRADLHARIVSVVTATNSAGSGRAASNRTAPIGPSVSQVRSSLRRLLVAHGRGAKIGALVAKGGYSFSFSTPSAGQLVVDWFRAGTHVLVASVSTRVGRAGRHRTEIFLTLKGGRILSGASLQRLKAQGSFIPSGLPGTTVRRELTLRR